MEALSIFDIFKIGVGPSSSHTLGPWKAALQFIQQLQINKLKGVTIDLFGSLAKTGVGHGTDIAVQLGLQGHLPETINTNFIFDYIQTIKQDQNISINEQQVFFQPNKHIVFHPHALSFHPNALTFTAILSDDSRISETYYSIGGGFVVQEQKQQTEAKSQAVPFLIEKGKDIIQYTDKTNLSVAQLVYKNELASQTSTAVKKGILHIWETMLACVYEGCYQEGILPGGLLVKRRAKALNEQLLKGKMPLNRQDWLQAIQQTDQKFTTINRWISCFALAVNEQNAAFGRVVTSPTNGAAGVIPAVLLYHYCFGDYKGEGDIMRFMLTAGAIGILFKQGATISAAVGGCQAEIGVSSAMAAAGLTELMGGSPRQVLMAAEIAMEHHLGLTCDPVGGLVQVPCIERNAMGAIKAITASQLALNSDPEQAIVALDTVIKTMWETAQDMHYKYKETAEGGLAIQIPVVQPSC